MSCGCHTGDKDGKAIVEFVRNKGKEHMPTQVAHEIECSCGDVFVMKTVVDQCPKCGMTYGVTPCGSANKENIKAAGIRF